MFWIILFLVGLAGVAYGWIAVRTSAERITISLELVKIKPFLRKVYEGAGAVFHAVKDVRGERGQRSRTGGPT
jgi:hypothetical protein